MMLSKLKSQLLAAQHRMKHQADKHHRDVEFAAGDWAYLRLQPYRQVSVARCCSHKLAPKYYGPFQILKRIGSVAYQLDLPPTARIHPVFHGSFLRQCHGHPNIQTCPYRLCPRVHIHSLNPKKFWVIAHSLVEMDLKSKF